MMHSAWMCRAAENIGIVAWYLLLGGANAVLYNICHYRVIQITSSTITPVIGWSLPAVLLQTAQCSLYESLLCSLHSPKLF